MNVDYTALPATVDILHMVLGAAIIILLLLLAFKRKPFQPLPGRLSESQTPPSQVAPLQPAPAPEPTSVERPVLVTHSPDAALQLLSLLQQEARFVDFLNEDLKGFSDAEIGAVARVVHEGGKKTLNQYFKLQPIRSEDEESHVTLPAGFNAGEVRVTGNVVGQPPFSGVLVHRGWRALEVNLPRLAEGHDASVVAQAEVEL